MHKLSRALSGVLVAVVLAACKDPLTVVNINNPDRLRVLATPSDLEVYTAGAFRSMHQGSIGGSDNNIAAQARVMSWENSSGLANFGMSVRSAIPRVFIDNNRGNQVQTGNLNDFNLLSRAARSSADGLYMYNVGGKSMGSAAQDARIKAFAWFTLGLSLGRLALVYDSSTIISPYDDLTFIPPLSSYGDLMTAALADLDSSVTWATAAQTATGANGFPLPVDWINGNALSAANFIRLVRTYRAQLRADVARTPTERAAVNWALVEADALNGITADVVLTTAIVAVVDHRGEPDLSVRAVGPGVPVHHRDGGFLRRVRCLAASPLREQGALPCGDGGPALPAGPGPHGPAGQLTGAAAHRGPVLQEPDER